MAPAVVAHVTASLVWAGLGTTGDTKRLVKQISQAECYISRARMVVKATVEGRYGRWKTQGSPNQQPRARRVRSGDAKLHL